MEPESGPASHQKPQEGHKKENEVMNAGFDELMGYEKEISEMKAS